MVRRHLRRWRWVCVVTSSTAMWVAPSGVSAQLISPGKLAAVHSELEGIRNCTRCHEFRKKGVGPTRCLECHEPLKARLDANLGFHASLVEDDCAVCHKEHFGTDFALVRLDTLNFDHARVGYVLEGRHAEASCRECHVPGRIAEALVLRFKTEHGAISRTFLGLPSECASCHEEETPHREQFAGQACTECHDVWGWENANGFDHDRTDYRLTGAHRTADCAGCHQMTVGAGDRLDFAQYTGVNVASCTECHEDEHRGDMPGRCESCHNTGRWRDVDRSRVESSFDHEVTGFSLAGRHGAAPCSSCHKAPVSNGLVGVRITFRRGTASDAFPKPVIGNCLACHVDRHEGVFEPAEEGGDCVACHGQETWLPAAYDVARHNRDADFQIMGAHVVVSCDGCHTPTGDVPTFVLGATGCLDCHVATNPHADQFADRTCDACHTENSFRVRDFDHDQTRFPLDGAHSDGTCDACHPAAPDGAGSSLILYRPLGIECRDCHGGIA